MSMTNGDWERLERRFDKTDSEIQAFGQDLRQHILDDQAVATALKAHVDACNESKVRRRRSWKFWAGVILAIAAPLVVTMIEHWLFAKNVLEAVKTK